MKNNMTEKMQRVWGKSLKNLKNLMQIFKRPAVVSVRTVPVESTVKVAQGSRIPSYLPLLATVLMLTFGVGNAWGEEAKMDGDNKAWKNANRTWSNSHVTFTISGTNTNDGDKHIDVPANSDQTISWSVETGYTINVTSIKIGIGYNGWLVGKCDIYLNNVLKETIRTTTGSDKTYSGYSLGNDGSFVLKTSKQIDLYNIWIYYTITPNTYYVRFNGNGETEGTMSNQEFTWDASSVALSANEFEKAYTITFNSNDGSCERSSADVEYLFTGWNTESNGTGTGYENTQGVRNITSVNGAIYDLYAQWDNSEAAVTLPAGTKDGYFLAGWNKGGVRVGRPGETYYPEGGTSAITLVADWQENITPEFEGDGASDAMKVGDTYTGFSFSNTSTSKPTNNSDDVFYYIIDNIDVNDHVEGCASGKEDSVISYNPSTNTLTALNAGTADITFYHKAVPASHVVASSTTFSITVEKYSNTISCNWDGWSKTANFDEEIGVTFSSNNDTGTPIVVTSGAGVAAGNGSYDAVNHKVVAGHNVGSASWTISQAEDYKYEAASAQTLTVTVGALPSPGCDVLNEPDPKTIGDSNYELTWEDENAAGTLYFQNYCETNHTGGVNVDQYINVDGVWQWVRVYQIVYDDTKWHDYGNYSTPLNQGAKGVRFSRYGTYKRYFQNVRVSRAKRFDIEDADGNAITKIDMPSKSASGDATTATFYIDYSTCDAVIKVASDHPHITVSDASFSSTTAGRKAITLTYNSSETEEISATVTIYTRYDHETLTVNAETLGKLSTTLEYIGSDSYSVNDDNVAATSLFQVRDQNGDLVASPAITLSSSNTSAINTVSENRAIEFLCGADDVRITAFYAGDDDYAAASNSGAFYHDIDVIKLSDAITWDGLAEDGKIHVLADTTIAITMASSTHTSIASYASGSDTYMTVAGSAGAFTLTTLKVGEVTLTATSAGDCVYNAVSSTKTVVVDPCYHSIIWEQNFQGIQADENGHIDSTIVLNAYAVDSLGNRTSVGITYSIGSGSCAELVDGNKLHLKGVGEITVTATTATDDKYAIVSESKPVSVVLWGVNKAQSANDESDIVGGKVVINAPHATFTFGGETTISKFHAATVGGKPEGYQLAMTMDHDDGVRGDGTAKYYFTWECNANCSIQVTKISFWAKAYTSNATLTNNGKLSFNGEDVVRIGSAALTANDGDFKHFDKPGTYTDSVWITCKSTWQNFDFYIKNIVIEYTVYTTAPSPTGGIENLNATINVANKQTVDVSTLFGYAVAPPSDFEYSYEIVESTTRAALDGGTNFWADSVGDYTVRAKVNADEDHRESGWSSTKTIRVNRVPYIFNNGAADQAWNTLGNWNASWLPTDEDTVIVRGDLVIDREIEVKKLSIESGVVEIAPNGGLTVGAGGVSGATTSNFVLKADSDPESATIGQTGYLRISPDYAGDMPEASVEMYATAFYDVNGETGSKAVYQCVGAPIDTAEILASTVFNKGSYLYTWNESTGGWENSRTSLSLTTPFRGYEITQKKRSAGWTFTYAGDIVSGHNVKEIDLSYTTGKGYNLLANSFTAPIDITSFQSTDFTNASQTIYILNAGTMNESKERKGGNDAPGKWVGVPINTAEYLAEEGLPRVIAPMQGFWIKTNNNDPSKTPQLKLDYSRLVWGVDYSGLKSNTPLRVSKRETEQTEVEKMTISVSSESERDVLFLLESEQFDNVYEDGYDAYKVSSGSLDIYTLEGEDKLSVDATNSIIGTRVGVRTSAETVYTLSFNYVSDEEWALYDAETENTIDINEGMEYTFFAEPNSNITERFMIVAREDAPSVTTGNDKVTSDVRAHKFIKDSQLFILKNGVLYDATGARVK